MYTNENDVPVYDTNELELAAYLKARGHLLLSAKVNSRNLVNFRFADNGTSEDAQLYFEGSSHPARELFQAHRGLRALIKQVKDHSSQIGTEHSHVNKSRRNY